MPTIRASVYINVSSIGPAVACRFQGSGDDSLSISLDTWHDLIITYDGTNQLMYLDGELDQQRTSTYIRTDDVAYIGTDGDATGQSLDGNMSLVEIYNKVLTAEEVSNLYNDARYVLPNLEHAFQGGASLNISDCENESCEDLLPSNINPLV